MDKNDILIDYKKLIKLENQYLTKVIKQLGQKDIITEKDLDVCQKAFNKFCKGLNKDKISLLRKGEATLRKYLYEIDYNNLEKVRDYIIKMCNEFVEGDSISSPILIVMIGALIEYVILKRKEDVIDDENSM